MTCIVALKIDGGVLMGADSAGVGGYALQHRVDPKIYRVGAMLLGFTTSFRMGQLLGCSLVLPPHDAGEPVHKYMVTGFVGAVRECLKKGGFAKKENEVETGGLFLVAYMGEVFEVCGDYQVAQTRDGFAAVGCGFDLALGSLMTSARFKTNPRDRIVMALEAAEYFSAGVQGPFMIEELK